MFPIEPSLESNSCFQQFAASLPPIIAMSKTSLYSWSQSEDLVEISFSVHRANLSKPGAFDLYVARTYVKLHLKTPKLFAEFDLNGDINPASGQNRVFATDSSLTIYLQKAIKGEQWAELVCRDKEIARARRKAGIEEVEIAGKQAEEQRREAALKLDRFAINEQMKLEGMQRKELEERKEREKREEEEKLYRALEEEDLKAGRQAKPGKDVFDPIPTRHFHSQQLPFTPKPIPTVPTRESQFTEPPRPRSLKELQGPAYDFHPVWIKAKADTLFHNGDYGSAIAAYTEVLKAEEGNVPALLNRSAALLKMWRVGEAMRDLKAAEEVKVEPPNPKYGVIIAVRKAVIGAWKGEYAEAIDELKAAMTSSPGLDLTADIHRIELRRESNTLKASADSLYRQGSLPAAKLQYQSALQVDPNNETILSNLSQIALKQGEFPLVLDYCTQALPLVVLNPTLKVKLLVRQAKAHRGLGDLEQGRKAVEQALAVEPENQSVLRLAQEIQGEREKEKYEGLKKEADNALRSGNPSLALQLYKDLLLTTRDREARSALYTNLCACHLLLHQYLDVVSTAERGLQLSPPTALQLRLLSRRASAFSALGQVHSAILDLRKALDLDPENPALMQELALLTQSRS